MYVYIYIYICVCMYVVGALFGALHLNAESAIRKKIMQRRGLSWPASSWSIRSLWAWRGSPASLLQLRGLGFTGLGFRGLGFRATVLRLGFRATVLRFMDAVSFLTFLKLQLSKLLTNLSTRNHCDPDPSPKHPKA